MVTTITVLFSERQPGKPEGERRWPAGQQPGGVEGSGEREGPLKPAATPLYPQVPAGTGPPGSPTMQAGITAKGKDCTVPSNNDLLHSLSDMFRAMWAQQQGAE